MTRQIPLSELAGDSCGVVIGSRENQDYPHRLYEMGFVPGCHVQMFSKQGKYAFIIKSHGIKYAISQELVENLMVLPFENI